MLTYRRMPFVERLRLLITTWSIVGSMLDCCSESAAEDAMQKSLRLTLNTILAGDWERTSATDRDLLCKQIKRCRPMVQHLHIAFYRCNYVIASLHGPWDNPVLQRLMGQLGGPSAEQLHDITNGRCFFFGFRAET